MENHAALSLEQFRAAARRVDVKTASDELGVDAEMFDQARAIWIYPGSAWLEELRAGGFFLTIGRSQWESQSREELDSLLWSEHYVIECTDSVSAENGTLDALVRGVAICEKVDIDDPSTDWHAALANAFSGFGYGDAIPTSDACEIARDAIEKVKNAEKGLDQ